MERAPRLPPAGLVCGSVPRAQLAWDASCVPDHVLPWAVRLFFAASVGFSIPLSALFDAAALKYGLCLTSAAFLGKFLSGAFGMLPPDPWLSAVQVHVLQTPGRDERACRSSFGIVGLFFAYESYNLSIQCSCQLPRVYACR